ncbi:uncharacterized protein LOC124843164 isoform X1 [Vigna umbellata]|uniref:uncharacterized protein LOC124843162 n=1 Tax=Vigna umbellata TaxID=87088 RepID=UPI001F5FCB02|nr:uncharacterized protein LOC124843162 [Vigna umbellata]XP_047175766.1 uncharacterized protein LOC124843162 [Vigna umbellata]XP_047175768.1 uncharacterized protein LOC124843162 [Vigna umbellata]XP_047175770.1 uncharacterized protein LOC124843164 isoform X1 [Vigna umbellata]XP_047175771.1 uncharacterized protein LOC124843164 isoform X1 [Vigna umbellata]XP_047175772.1 uncharacterized protein LOC124843164 isoform X1 [Vigna umbellata]
MFSQTHLLCLRPFSLNGVSMAATLRTPFSVRVSSSAASTWVAGDAIPEPVISEQHKPDFTLPSQTLVEAAPVIEVAKNLGFRPNPELGFLSYLFVLSMAFGAFFSVAVVSIPTLIAFGRLGASVNKLAKVVSEEVPGTLSSLKLSSLELNELTQQLSLLRQLRHKTAGVPMGTKDMNTVRSKSSSKKHPTS